MEMKKLVCFLIMAVFALTMPICFSAARDRTTEAEFYNPREIYEYGHRAMMERQEDRNRQVKLNQYQQQEYREQQQMLYQQSMYNQTHRNGGEIDPSANLERFNR